MSITYSRVNERSITAIILVLVPIALLVSTTQMRFADLGGAFSPVFFPRIVLWLFIVLASINLVIEFVHQQAPNKPAFKRAFVIAGAFVLYAFTIMPLGFLLASILFCVICLVSLSITKPFWVASFSIGLPASLVLLFNHVLMLPLPTSPFTHWF
mgnify:FL=1